MKLPVILLAGGLSFSVCNDSYAYYGSGNGRYGDMPQPTIEVNISVLNGLADRQLQYQDAASLAEESFQTASYRSPNSGFNPNYRQVESPRLLPVYAPPISGADSVSAVQEDEGSGGVLEQMGVPGELSANVGLTTDYTFRGVTQNRETPALQGGFDYTHDSGMFAGLWGSNVDFADGDEASIEIDYYAGYAADMSESLSANAAVFYYTYPGADGSLNYDYWEFVLGISHIIPLGSQELTTGLNFSYSPENFGESGDAYYLELAASSSIGSGFSIDGSFGRQWIGDEIAFGLPDYNNWTVGLAYAVDDFELKLQYVDTDLSKTECSDGCDAKAVASVSKTW